MSFCCGASMIGTKGTLKHIRTQIHNVPLLFCPVCHRVQVHYMVDNEYEILAEFAHNDGAAEINFEDYVDYRENDKLYENCVNHENEEPQDVIQNQIDMSLDLFTVAKSFGDKEWQEQLLNRLKVLSERKSRFMQKRRKEAI